MAKRIGSASTVTLRSILPRSGGWTRPPSSRSATRSTATSPTAAAVRIAGAGTAPPVAVVRQLVLERPRDVAVHTPSQGGTRDGAGTSNGRDRGGGEPAE